MALASRPSKAGQAQAAKGQAAKAATSTSRLVAKPQGAKAPLVVSQPKGVTKARTVIPMGRATAGGVVVPKASTKASAAPAAKGVLQHRVMAPKVKASVSVPVVKPKAAFVRTKYAGNAVPKVLKLARPNTQSAKAKGW